MPGAGSQGAGNTPAGGLPGTAPAQSFAVFQDPVSGASLTGRLIDIASGQYVIGANGLPAGMDTVPQLVQLALAPIDFSSVDTILPNHAARVTSIVNAQLAAIVNAQLAKVVEIAVSRLGGSRTRVVIRWRDLTTNTEHTNEV